MATRQYKRDKNGRFALVAGSGSGKVKVGAKTDQTDTVTGQGAVKGTSTPRSQKPTAKQAPATKRAAAQVDKPVVWDGPSIAKASVKESHGIDTAWQSSAFDDYKHSMRIGAQKAQREGYIGSKTGDAWQKESKRLSDLAARGREPPPEDYSRAMLEDAGAHIFSRMTSSTPTTKPTYRGVNLPADTVAKLVQGGSYTSPLSSFADRRQVAERFATGGGGWSSEDARKGLVPVVVKVAPGAKTVDFQGERASLGQFRVESVKPYQLKQAHSNKTTTAYEVLVKQTSLKESPTKKATAQLEAMARQKEKEAIARKKEYDAFLAGTK
jgi:hypothetical protein